MSGTTPINFELKDNSDVLKEKALEIIQRYGKDEETVRKNNIRSGGHLTQKRPKN